ncbi:FecR family protein [Pedobacter psychrodurus]|uniref:FecR family protein n=1 Tax=Pedobacter psychrodurus TaxID=2530456 RepID=A0A4R0Q167_9SPHI|nr:FecR family protein [Pedobacter psychrodurus]TCD28716.1 FecR family protein [Pedobacter psychrodurus]
MQDKFTSEYIERLAHRYRQGTLNAEERVDFEAWYDLQNQKELDLSNSELDSAEQLKKKLLEGIVSRLDFHSVQPRRSLHRLWPRIGIAAAVIIGFGSALIYFAGRERHNGEITAENDIAPGRASATLTLADGRKISIGEVQTGKIADQSGVIITKMSDGQIFYQYSGANKSALGYNMLETSKGEQTTIRLPDGSLVYLNAASSIKFPASFAGLKKRTVEFSGEGYFEIAKDKMHPFIVNTGAEQIEVLGTHFNINSYPEEPVAKTTLLEGSIKLITDHKSILLSPGEQGVLKNGELTIRPIDTEEIVAWKNNEFLFKDDDFRTNMRKIARWYDLEIIYEEDAPHELRLGGFLSRTRKLSAVIRLLENTGNVHFRLSGKKLYVRK